MTSVTAISAPDEQQPRQHVERGLEAVVERDRARRRDAGVGVGIVARRRRGDRAHRGDADRPADLTARVDEAGGDARVGALDAGEARDRDRDEREPHPGAAEHEGREEIPEVAARRPAAASATRRRRPRRAARRSASRRTPKRPTTICATFDVTTTVSAKPMNATPLCDRRVVEDVLEVERQQEELGERDRADDGHRRVRAGQRAQRKMRSGSSGERRAQLDHDERERSGRRTPAKSASVEPSAPAVGRRPRRRVDEQHQPGGDRGRAREVEVAMRQVGAALAQQHRRERDRGDRRRER